MILDYANEFTAAGGKVVTNQSSEIQANSMGGTSDNAKDWAAGDIVVPYLRVTGTADVNKLTSMTVVISAADDASNTNGVVLSTKTILLAALTKNTLHHLPALQPGTSKKVLLALLTVTGTACDSGAKVIVGLRSIDGSPQNQNVSV